MVPLKNQQEPDVDTLATDDMSRATHSSRSSDPLSHNNKSDNSLKTYGPPKNIVYQDPYVTYYEHDKRRQRRVCLTLAIYAAFLVGVAVIVIWRAQYHMKADFESRSHSKDTPTTAPAEKHLRHSGGGEKVAAFHKYDKMAKNALAKLNEDLIEQSKHIAPGCESTLLIVRHCEKFGPNTKDAMGNEHCSYEGFERAAYLETLFGPDSRWPTPAHLFSLATERPGFEENRMWETLQPLSAKTGIPVKFLGRNDLPYEFNNLLRSGSMCGKASVISWKHSWIRELASMMGCSHKNGCPAEYPDASFDEVWQIKYVFQPPELANVTSGDASRLLKGLKQQKKNKSRMYNKDGWNVYAAVTQQNFDPLAFSKAAGDYPEGREVTPNGGRWHN